ncbi:MFS transporter [Mangrovactinospora gilvigrisea]|uniref:Putative proline/betaine transporter n=1 Tax=Mangrovactinospora gilvigrisea TaxID=1428644 RepID=A0A1J7BHZ2_9ACTN|nr:MFS transporter [Mangrovactinospora gilvigrisea]OIV38283.1 MFS transporter [Mangrovactinospora gilvigrisea]
MTGTETTADDAARPSATEVDLPTVRRAIAGAAMGNCIEWFDFGVFAYLATTLGKVFFQGGANGTLETFATLAVAFLMRPLGGVFFGPLGDKIGRQKVLATTVILMSGATLLIGVLPSYAAIGIWSPILLLVVRLVQGFATGGEYGGAATFIAEYAPDKRRGFFCSFLEFGTLGGYVLGAGIATGLQLGLSDQALMTWGWRIPFLIAAPLGIVGLWLRMKLEDTPAFRDLTKRSQPEHTALKATLTSAWRPILFCIALVLVYNVVDYTVLTYMPTYLSQVLRYSTTTSLLISIGMMLLMMAGISQVGRLSDRIGRKPLLVGSCVGIFVLSAPAFLMMGTGNIVLTWVGLLLLSALLLGMLGTMSATLPNLFPTQYRYGAFAVGYNVSTAVFGGTASFVISALIDSTGNHLMPAFYMMAAAAISVVPIMKIKETAGKPMMGSKPVVTRTRRPARATTASSVG